jgi:SAM-dependent methyltransferase
MTGRLEACIKLAEKVGVKNKRVLDVGCSYLWFIEFALKNKAKSASGIEPNAQKVVAARLQVPKAKILQGFADKLDFRSRSMDVVSLFDVIEHIPPHTESKVLSEINRVLVKGGYLLLSTPNFHPLANIFDPGWYFGHRHYSKQHLIKLLDQSGFKVTNITTRGGLWEIIGMLDLYVSKWIFRTQMLFEDFIETKRRLEFNKIGYTHVLLIAQKINPAS